jgi:hypothetical protein
MGLPISLFLKFAALVMSVPLIADWWRDVRDRHAFFVHHGHFFPHRHFFRA